MKKNYLLESFIKLLLEKGGKESKGKIKFYNKELEMRDIETQRKYEISSIDRSDPNNMIFSLEAYDEDGRKFTIQKTQDEILKDYNAA